LGQTVTELPDNATSPDLGSAAELEQPATEYTDPVESAFESATSVTEPEVEVTAQGNIGEDPKIESETKAFASEPGSVTLTSEEVFQLNRFLATSKYSLSDLENLKSVFEKLKTPTGRGGWWGLGLLDRM
jgi:hypothetical protein